MTTRCGRFAAVGDSRLSYLVALKLALVTARLKLPSPWLAVGTVSVPRIGPSITGGAFQVTDASVQVLLVKLFIWPAAPPAEVGVDPTVIWSRVSRTGNDPTPLTANR